MRGRPGQSCPSRLRGLSTGPAHSSAGSRQRPSSAPPHQPSPSTPPLSCLYAASPRRPERARGVLHRRAWSVSGLHSKACECAMRDSASGPWPTLQIARISPLEDFIVWQQKRARVSGLVSPPLGSRERSSRKQCHGSLSTNEQRSRERGFPLFSSWVKDFIY